MTTDLVTSGVSPPPLVGAVGTFDTADGYLLVFGGVNADGVPMPWTWSFVHNNWTNLSSAIGTGPSARWGEGLAYDPADGYVLLFGGCLNGACSEVSNQTWAYAHDTWTNLTSDQSTPPPARGRTMMTYDASDGYVFLFGGTGVGQTELNDEWGFTGGDWFKVGNLSSPAPSPRFGSSMTYDPGTSSVILFGGTTGSDSPLGDTWSYHAGNWTNLTGTFPASPSPRRLAPMTFDGADGYLLLVNGYGTGYLGDEWTFGSTAGWTRLLPRGGPEASFGGVLAYDPVDRYVVYFSGETSEGALASTLVYANGTWTLLINPTHYVLTPIGILLIVGGAVLIPGAIAVWAASRYRRRQERQLGEGFTLRPGETPTWIPTGAALRARVVQQVLPLLVVFVALGPFFALTLDAGGGGATIGLLVGTVAIFGVLAAVLSWVTMGQLVRAVGLTRSGVIVQRRMGELRVPWTQLQPGVIPPRRNWYWFHYVLPGRDTMMRGFATTIAQGRGIVSSPFAPPWVLSPAVSAGLGVVPREVVFAAGGPPTAATSTPGSPSPGTAPPPASVGSSVAAPGWGSPVSPYASSPAPRPPTPLPVSSVPLPTSRPPPGMVACPRCGQLNRTDRAAFCTACGARLR